MGNLINSNQLKSDKAIKIKQKEAIKTKPPLAPKYFSNGEKKS